MQSLGPRHEGPAARAARERHGRVPAVAEQKGREVPQGRFVPLPPSRGSGEGVGRAGAAAAERGEEGDGALLEGVSARTGLDCSYQQYAWGSDELLPVSNAGLDNNGHVGITLVEALDTLWLMGMRKEFDAAVKWIRESLSLDVNMDVSAFDYNTRLLGGLLSAYELSRRGILLEKAVEVGDLLLRTFKGSGFPAVGLIGVGDGQPLINPRTGALEQASSKVFLAEVGTLTLEMK